MNSVAERTDTNVIRINWDAYPKQNLFHQSNADVTIFGGSKGGGKSAALVMDAVAYALKFAGSKIYLFRRTFSELEAKLIDELLTRAPRITKDQPLGIYKYNESKHIATFLNGSKIMFRYITSFKDAKQYQGQEMDYVGVDELTEHEEESIQILLSCMRSPKGFPTRFKASCNPGGIGHAWVKTSYIDTTNKGRNDYIDPKSDNLIRFIPSQVYDNPAIVNNDPKYVRRLENLPPMLRKAYLEGSWDIFEGQAFEEWNYNVHVCPSFPIPKHWRRWRSADNGHTDPFAWYWFAVDEFGRVHIYREFTREYGDKKVIYADQAKEVTRLSVYKEFIDGKMQTIPEKIDFTVVGHDAWAKGPTSQGKCINDFYIEGGVKDCICAVTDRKVRKATWHEYLKADVDPLDGQYKAKVVIHDCCTRLIKTLPMQVSDIKEPEKVAETDFDHWFDGAGYGLIAYHSVRSKPLPEEKSEMQKAKEAAAKRRAKKKAYF